MPQRSTHCLSGVSGCMLPLRDMAARRADACRVRSASLRTSVGVKEVLAWSARGAGRIIGGQPVLPRIPLVVPARGAGRSTGDQPILPRARGAARPIKMKAPGYPASRRVASGGRGQPTGDSRCEHDQATHPEFPHPYKRLCLIESTHTFFPS